MRIAIVGLGIVGASTARALARDGAEVTVFEKTAPGAGTTGTSYGWINSHRKEPQAYHDLNVAGMAEYEALWEPGCDWYIRSGTLEWAADDEGRQRLDNNDTQLRAYGYPCETLTRERATELAGDVRIPTDVTAVSWYPTEGYVLPLALLTRLRDEARDHGARLRCPTEVTRVEPLTNGVRIHTTNSAPEHFDKAVLAAGRWTEGLTKTLEPTVPMTLPEDPASPGFLVQTTPLAASAPVPIISPLLNFRPNGDGRLLLQALDLNGQATDGERSQPDPSFSQEILQRLKPLLREAENAGIEKITLGLRSLPADGHTVAGPDDSGRIYTLATHSGITLGPLLGRLAGQEILHEQQVPQLRDFRPQRFTGVTKRPQIAAARRPGEQ